MLQAGMLPLFADACHYALCDILQYILENVTFLTACDISMLEILVPDVKLQHVSLRNYASACSVLDSICLQTHIQIKCD